MALKFNTTQTLKAPANIFAGLSIPATALTITGGEPDATQNPNAVHLGYTREGLVVTTTRELEEEFADEKKAAIISGIKTTGIQIAGEFLQVLNFDLLKLLTEGVGTIAASVGNRRLKFGQTVIAYTGVAAIFENPNSAGKYGYINLYRALNEGGLELPLSGKKLSGLKFNFKAFEVDGRAANDTLGALSLDDASFV